MKRTFVDWWQALGARERGFLGVGALVLVAAAVYLWLWEPPAEGIRKLGTDLPLLQTQYASLSAMADEATRLRAAAGSAAPIAPAERVAAVRRSLERAGLWNANAGTTATDRAPVQTLSIGGTVTTVAAAPAQRAAPPEITADGDRVRVRFDDVDYGVWAAWLAAAETELSARTVRASVAANAPKSPVGHVRTDALLDWTTSSKPEAR